MKRTIWLGVAFLVFELAIVAAFVTWSLLPEGRYPVVVAGIPAIPFVGATWYSLKKGGLVNERGEVAMPSWVLLLIGIGVLIVSGIVAILFLAP